MSAQELPPLLGKNDPPPAFAENQGAPTPFVLVCDHAGRQIPACLDSLGLPAAELDRHIAWDIGAAGLARELSAALDAWLITQTYSRLVIDCNRGPEREDLIVSQSDGAAVPGNVGLSDQSRAARLTEIYEPYHAAISAELDRRSAQGQEAVLVSVHSFTPSMNGVDRPWHVGVLHDGASASSRTLLTLLEAEPGIVAGDNEPYAMDSVDYTIPRHAIARGLPYLELEVRQDLICEPSGQRQYAALLARLIPPAFGL